MVAVVLRSLLSADTVAFAHLRCTPLLINTTPTTTDGDLSNSISSLLSDFRRMKSQDNFIFRNTCGDELIGDTLFNTVSLNPDFSITKKLLSAITDFNGE